MADEKRTMATFSLEEAYQNLLDEIAWRNRVNKTEMIRKLIDAGAVAQGITPLADVDPKFSASTLEMT